MKIAFISAERRALRRLFNRDYLAKQLPGSLCATSINLDRYLNDPRFRELSPHPLFDAQFYLDSNPDVDRSGINPLLHFVRHGWQEGRDPHPLFDMRFYKGSYLMRAPHSNALLDYLRGGAARGNKPYAGFDYDLYRELVSPGCRNEDVLSDFAQNYNTPSRKQFASVLSRKALLGNPTVPRHYSDFIPPRRTDAPLICDVIIPVKNSIQWVARALESVRLPLEGGYVSQVLLIDDGCSPESRTLLRKIVSSFGDTRVRRIENEGIHGFAAACNLGARSSRAPFMLFLNSDCLLSPGAVPKMLRAFESDSDVGLTCPLSNNAANVTVPLQPGMSYTAMERFVSAAQASGPIRYSEICTIVGHCLMLSRDCFEAVDGFDESWGLGYGEESDLHLRARARGFLGVITPDAYVYHFGGGTFAHEAKREQLQQENHQRFIQLWGESFSTFYRTVAPASPIVSLRRLKPLEQDSCDVLFILPGLTKGVGGVQVVIDAANFLISRGVDARVVILGEFNQEVLKKYGEPIYFNVYHCPNDRDLIQSFSIKAKIIVTTLFVTVPPAYALARRIGARLVSFIQGYEAYFLDGRFYEQVYDSYHLPDCLIATSEWLIENVRRHAPTVPLKHLPLGVDLNLFHPSTSKPCAGRVRVGMVIRAAPDKGQFVIREICHRLLSYRRDVALTIFIPDDYPFASAWSHSDPDTRVKRLPIDRVAIARELGLVDIFVDASLHEGYGLFPLEAMASGACVVASDSGGIRQFIHHEHNGFIVSAVNQPDEYLSYIERLMNDRDLLMRCQHAARRTAQDYDESLLFGGYQSLFVQLLNECDEISAKVG